MKQNEGKRIFSDVLSMIGIITIGLTVAIFVYPFLHESGHSIAAFAVGAEIKEFCILPVPYVMCNVEFLTNGQQIFIGVSGVLFPLFVSLVPPRRWFWSWYIRFLLMGISLLSFVISAVTLVLPNGGQLNPQDDMLQVLDLWTASAACLPLILSVMCIATVIIILRDKPHRMICKRFGI